MPGLPGERRRPGRGRGRGGLALTVALVLASAFAVGPAGAATATTPTPAPAASFPSEVTVDNARSAVSTVAGQVAAIEAQLRDGQAQLVTAQTVSGQAAEAYDAAVIARDAAAQELQQVSGRLSVARTGQARAGRDIGSLAATVYRSGGSLGALAVYAGTKDPGDLISARAAVGDIGDEFGAALATYRAAAVRTQVLRAGAARALATAQRTTAQTRSAATGAAAAATRETQALAAVASRRQTLIGNLATVQHISITLAAQRQDGLEEQARLAAIAKAEQAARDAAARAATSASASARARASASATSTPTATRTDAPPTRSQPSPTATLTAGPTSPPTRQPISQPTSQPTSRPRRTAQPTAAPTRPAHPTAAPSRPSRPHPTHRPHPSPSPTPTQTPAPPSAGTAGQIAVAWAKTQIGKPYVWGGSGPYSYDCSGLTMRAWEQAGVYLSHDAKVQYLQSTPVTYDQLQIGDLIFWTTGGPSQIFHVALYNGNDSDVVAPHTGAFVMIESPIWDNGYPRLYGRP